MPRWRTRMEPACTTWPSPTLTPRRWPTLSRPFFELEPAFLCAMAYSSFLARGRLAGFVSGFLVSLLVSAAFARDALGAAALAVEAAFASGLALARPFLGASSAAFVSRCW